VLGVVGTALLGTAGAVIGVGAVPNVVAPAVTSVGIPGIEVFYAQDTGNSAYGRDVPFVGIAPSNLVNVGVNGVAGTGAVGRVSAGLIGGAFEPDAFQNDAFQIVLPGTNVPVTGVYGTALLNPNVGLAGGYKIVSVSGVLASAFVNNSPPILGGIQIGIGAPVTGVFGTGQVGIVNASAALIAPSVVAYGIVGTVLIQSDLSFTLPRGLYDLRPMRGRLGRISLQTGANPTLTGLQAVGMVGNVVYESSVSPAGLQVVGLLGSVSTRTDFGVVPAGLRAVGVLGQLVYKNSYVIAGVRGTGAVGVPTVNIPARVSETGVAAAGGVGVVGFRVDCNVSVAGLQAVMALGTTSIRVNPSVAVAGLASIGQVGSTIEESAYAVLGVRGKGHVGVPSPTYAVDFRHGVQGTGQVGAVTIRNDYTMFPTGVYGIGIVGVPEYPHLISPADTDKMIYTRAPQPR
jgi:hypothetical protein